MTLKVGGRESPRCLGAEGTGEFGCNVSDPRRSVSDPRLGVRASSTWSPKACNKMPKTFKKAVVIHNIFWGPGKVLQDYQVSSIGLGGRAFGCSARK